MQSQDNKQEQTFLMTKEEILEKRKAAIKNLVETMLGTMPVMMQSLVRMNISSVYLFVDNLTYEQTEDLINQAEEIIGQLRG